MLSFTEDQTFGVILELSSHPSSAKPVGSVFKTLTILFLPLILLSCWSRPTWSFTWTDGAPFWPSSLLPALSPIVCYQMYSGHAILSQFIQSKSQSHCCDLQGITWSSPPLPSDFVFSFPPLCFFHFILAVSWNSLVVFPSHSFCTHSSLPGIPTHFQPSTCPCGWSLPSFRSSLKSHLSVRASLTTRRNFQHPSHTSCPLSPFHCSLAFSRM